MKRNGMTAEEYREFLLDFGLKQTDAGWLFGGRSFISGRRWASEGPPFAVSCLVRLVQRKTITLQQLKNLGSEWRVQE